MYAERFREFSGLVSRAEKALQRVKTENVKDYGLSAGSAREAGGAYGYGAGLRLRRGQGADLARDGGAQGTGPGLRSVSWAAAQVPGRPGADGRGARRRGGDGRDSGRKAPARQRGYPAGGADRFLPRVRRHSGTAGKTLKRRRRLPAALCVLRSGFYLL